jgi:signal transduction histidine kinase
LRRLGTFQLGITQKILILFLFFVLIFYGTLVVLFTNTQKIMAISERIVSKNNEVSTLSKVMYENLLSMDANEKKYKLLGRDIYLGYFEESRDIFEANLQRLLALESPDYQMDPAWKRLSSSYRAQLQNVRTGDEGVQPGAGQWASEQTINFWLETISEARLANEKEIETSLLTINNKGKLSVRNGMIGMGITIIAGLVAALFLSKSILHPLKELKHALKNISSEKDSEEIQINSKDEFGELAAAFNDMSRQLKEEEELRSEFIATLSHEIRTPLSSIKESVNMILEGVLGDTNEKQTKFLEIAQSEIYRIHDLLNHLLQVSRLDAESRKVTPVLIDPNKLVLEVSRSLIPTARAKNVTIKLHKMAEPPVLIGVKKELQQVLFNLLDNAIKFSPKGGEVTINLLLEKDENMLIYKVSDQGPGVSDQEQSLIFSKYYRAKRARSHTDGVGLGLSISKRIIQFHGGEIYVKNNENRGCSFYCTLPCEIETKAKAA